MSLTKRPFLILGLTTALALAASVARVSAQEDKPAAPAAEAKPEAPIELPHVDFPSLDGKTTLITHLFRPPGDEAGRRW